MASLIETSNSYARGLLRGIHRYLREHRPWTIDLPEQGRGAPPPLHLAQWRGDGIIARIENRRIAEAVRQAGLPTIDLSAADYDRSIAIHLRTEKSRPIAEHPYTTELADPIKCPVIFES